ncbi:MAG TPA: hypothetical protein ENK31_02910, partial [Nannocystis exedens]|nr:hypothetical protein [Nannocystis exedens]
MYSKPLRSLLLFLVSLLFGCSPRAIANLADFEVFDSESESSSSSTSWAATTSATDSTGELSSDPTTTTENTAADVTTTDTTETTETTGGDPVLPPSIEDLLLTPSPILANGSITVTVTTTNTQGVLMELDDGSAVELTAAGGGIFKGEILALSGLENGNHVATLSAWQADSDDTDVRLADYVISLPQPGTEGFWETGDTGTGLGQVRALGVLPSGTVEFGTFTGNGVSRCYLRRRDKGGSWAPDDLIEVLPGVNCDAIDLEIGDDGRLYLLMRRYSQGGWLWWLSEMSSWGEDLESRGLGSKDEAAHALALHGTTLAVCGSAPTGEDDLSDAMVRIFREDLQGQGQVFPYWRDPDLPHAFTEVSRGCDFVSENTLVLVGEAYGMHMFGDLKRNRRFEIFYSLAENEGEYQVAEAGLVTQSAATDVDVDPSGRIMITGYICND